MGLTPDWSRAFTVILSHPQSPENIGLTARAMRNTGFARLRLVLEGPLTREAHITAVHAEDILEDAEVYPDVAQAVAGLDVVLAAVARRRKNFPSLSLDSALERCWEYPAGTRIGFLFGNERTGLTSSELLHSNFRFTIPQASDQPSYNLASAVLLTLFTLARMGVGPGGQENTNSPLPREEQDACIRLILHKLEQSSFLHEGNRRHVSEMVYALLGRLAMTARDRDLLLAIFDKTITP
jgi:TrmH family RNA methyltransferase